MSPNSKTNQILVPTDFSEQSLIAIGQTFNLARFNKAEISLLYVIEEDPLGKIFSFGSNKEDKKLEEKIKKKLEEVAAETTKKSNIKVNYYVTRGKIYEEIHKVAEMINAVFIVMGTDGSTGIKSRFIGSNTLRVITNAPCPVITIKGSNHRDGCKNIVLPLDLSKETKEKVTKAIEIAQYFNSSIRIITVNNSSDEFHVNKLKRQLQQVKDFISSKNVPCTGESVQTSNLVEGVIEYAKKVDADLIMIMTQDEMNFTDLFMGSTAQAIINGTDIPVLAVRPVERENKTVFVPY